MKNLIVNEELISKVQTVYKLDRKSSIKFIQTKPSLMKKHIKNEKNIMKELEKLNFIVAILLHIVNCLNNAIVLLNLLKH